MGELQAHKVLIRLQVTVKVKLPRIRHEGFTDETFDSSGFVFKFENPVTLAFFGVLDFVHLHLERLVLGMLVIVL